MKTLERNKRLRWFAAGFIASLTVGSFADSQQAMVTSEVTLRAGFEADELPTLGELLRPGTPDPETVADEAAVARRMTESAPDSRSSPQPFQVPEGTSNSCRIQVLQKLGWNIRKEAGRADVAIRAGNPCNNLTLERAREAGELDLLLPENYSEMDSASLQRSLDQAITSEASICAYKHLFGPAAQRAAAALVSNRNFQFFYTRPLVRFYDRVGLWEAGCQDRNGMPRCFRPKDSPSAGLNQFTRGRSSTDCAIGLQVAEFEMLRQLYGNGFDRAFSRKEIVIAEFGGDADEMNVTQTSSATWGQWTEADTHWDNNGRKAAAMGMKWYEGLSGYIGNVFGRQYLRKIADQGENFLILEVTPEAAEQLRTLGDLSAVNRKNREIWELGQNMSDTARKIAGGNRPLTDYEWRVQGLQERVQKMRDLLNEPVYTGVKVYVHGLGVMTLGQHILRLLRVNPDTPYSVMLYASRVHSGLYQRYVNHLVQSCRQ